ncbi:hypothetical protein L1077_23630 [Pseudoalteromonas luteoviolacea]|nr:hypothetical protein [Pseudoalteromonas luteoviolacea]MCF6442423.1 hypothetical protein [Pseudoalteromonas luteoviolacea]
MTLKLNKKKVKELSHDKSLNKNQTHRIAGASSGGETDRLYRCVPQ